MELCEGGSLKQVMDKVMQLRHKPLNERPGPEDKPPFTEIHIACIMQQALVALAALHANKLIHRDIKSANVLLSKHGEVKLGDLGAAAAVSYSSKMFTSLVGTAFFGAPEILNDEPYGDKVDIWSIGARRGRSCPASVIYLGCTCRPFGAVCAAGIMALELAEYLPPNYEA